MTRAFLLLLPLLLLVPPAHAQQATAEPAPTCPAAATWPAPAPIELPRAAAAAARGRLSILAVGGTLVAGTPGTGEAGSYPGRMAAHLARALPGVDITLAFRTQREGSARRVAAQLPADLAALHPDLVLWPSGTREAVRHIDPARYAETLTAGVEAAHAAGADIVLVEPQFAPGFAAVPDIDTYRDTMRTVAELHGAVLFPRHDLMQAWHEAAALDLSRRGRERAEAEASRLFDCLGAALADMLKQGFK